MGATKRRLNMLCKVLALGTLLAASRAQATAAVLSSINEFVEALRKPSTQHVELSQHLDLSDAGVECEEASSGAALFTVGTGLNSIRPNDGTTCTALLQGNCTEPLPDWAQVADGTPSMPGQCAIAVPCTFMRNAEPFENSLWLNNLHVQLKGATAPNTSAISAGTIAILWSGRPNAKADLWVSNTTIAGEGKPSTGMAIRGGTVCIADSAITRHSAVFPGIHATSDSVWAAMTRTTFIDNAGTSSQSAVLAVSGANVLVKNCTFSGRFPAGSPRGAADIANDGGQIWAESNRGDYVLADGSDAVQQAADMPDNTKFTSDADPRVRDIQAESLEGREGSLLPGVEVGEEKFPLVAAVLIAVSIVLLALAAFCLTAFCCRSRIRRWLHKGNLERPSSAVWEDLNISRQSWTKGGTELGSQQRSYSRQSSGSKPKLDVESGTVSSQWAYRLPYGAATESPGFQAGQPHQSLRIAHERAALDGTEWLLQTTTKLGMSLEATLSASSTNEQLSTALDNLAEAQDRFAGRYLIMPDRVRGGQALVQYARGGDGGFFQYAIKFFHRPEDFEVETRMYREMPSLSCMPRLFDATDNHDKRVRSRSGFIFPPYIVMERGITLKDWLKTPRGFPAVLLMFSDVAKQLRCFHASGFVHRDLKPDNVLWMLQSQEWKLIDYGIAAPAGEQMSAACSLGYAPPEVVQAFSEKQPVEILAAHDIWALGVMVFEAFTGGPAISSGRGRQHVIDLANGDACYLWESLTGTCSNSAEMCKDRQDISSEQSASFLRSKARDAVMACLQREPEQRPSAEQLLDMLHELGMH